MNYVEYIRNKIGTDAINLTGVNVLIINERNQVMLQKRGTFPYKWGLIGGITELGESLEETAVREAKEETGLDIWELYFIGTTSGENCYIKFPNGDKAYFITIGYYTKNYSGELMIDNAETKELRFFNYKELPEDIPRSHKIMLDKYYSRSM
ncbi:MAG: NUDIX domain-containing protein [Bacillota bacterium]|nr:NUDIX domain-containing protein [Bacillota bacterium]